MYMPHSFLFHHSNYVLASTMYTPQQHPQPAPTPPPANIPHGFNMEAQVPFRPWSTGMCDCMDDVLNCCITCWCPCITFGQVAEIIDRGASSCGTAGALYGLLFSMACFHWVYSCTYRSKLRMQYNLMEAPCCDCCVHYCCELCSLCQMYRELRNQGFDMSIGWHMNMQRGVTPVSRPPAVQGMTR